VSKQTNLLQGTLDLLILKPLALGELHGLGISRRIEQITQGTFQVKPGVAVPCPPSNGGSGVAGFVVGESETIAVPNTTVSAAQDGSTRS